MSQQLVLNHAPNVVLAPFQTVRMKNVFHRAKLEPLLTQMIILNATTVKLDVTQQMVKYLVLNVNLGKKAMESTLDAVIVMLIGILKY